MTFGKSNGPPASDKQIKYLLSLIQQAGYDDLRDARRPLGLTQRQGSGKFTVPEASELIDQLLAAEHDADNAPGPAAGSIATAVKPVVASTAATRRLARERSELIAGLPADDLAAELERRGWIVTAPGTA